MKVFINKGVDGLIIVPCEGAEKPVADLVESGFPVVLIDRTFDNIDVSSVTLNNIKATFIAVSELVRQAISTGEKRTYANLLLTIGCA